MHKVFYCISESLEFDEQDIPNTFSNRNKNLAHHIARYSLSKILNSEFNILIPFFDLKLKNYSEIDQAQNLTASIAHTKEVAIGVISHKKSIKSLGVDIEYKNRPMKKESSKYFKNENDTINADLLRTWCIKEASFKALSNLGLPIKFLKEVILSNTHFSFEMQPEKQYPYEVLDTNDFVIALAICTQEDYQLIEVIK